MYCRSPVSDSCLIFTSPAYPGAYAIVEGGKVRRISIGQRSKVKLAEGIIFDKPLPIRASSCYKAVIFAVGISRTDSRFCTTTSEITIRSCGKAPNNSPGPWAASNLVWLSMPMICNYAPPSSTIHSFAPRSS
jgi:hypothetical protein